MLYYPCKAVSMEQTTIKKDIIQENRRSFSSRRLSNITDDGRRQLRVN